MQCCKPGEVRPDSTGQQYITVDENRFEHVFTSKYNKMRIWKILKVSEKSRQEIEDRRTCDAGGWYCPSTYPKALDKLMAKKKDFAQVEDWNRKKSKDDEEYQKKYMAKMAGK